MRICRTRGHRVKQLVKLCGPTQSLDHGKPPLHHDRDVNDLHDLQTGTSITLYTATGESRWSNEQSGPWDKPLRHDRENLHDLQQRDIDHRIHAQLGSLNGRNDHGNRPVHHEGKVDDPDELQLRRLHSFLQSEP